MFENNNNNKEKCCDFMKNIVAFKLQFDFFLRDACKAFHF